MTKIHCAGNPHFVKLARETRIGLKRLLIQETGGRISARLGGGKRLLVLRIGNFGKSSNLYEKLQFHFPLTNLISP